MACKDFVFKLTSGQLDSAGFKEKLLSKVHTVFCRRCRHFQRNDRVISRHLANYRQEIDSLEK